MLAVSYCARGAVPSGTVTFLFTDIEGSTVRWELDPGGMTEALTEHDVLLRSMIEANGGVVFSTGGDGFAAAFADAPSALRAAVEVQDRVRLPVRMGLHTGTAEERDGNYFGRTLNRAARIMSAGHGGQIVVSDVTAALIRRRLGRDGPWGASARRGGADDAAVAGRSGGSSLRCGRPPRSSGTFRLRSTASSVGPRSSVCCRI